MKLTIIIVAIIGFGAVAGAIIVGTRSFDGVVTKDPYETGLIWDEIQKNRADSGLTIRLTAKQFKTGTNRVIFQIEKSKPIGIDSVTLLRSRPSTVELDKEIRVTHLSDKRYEAEVDFPKIGNWDLIAKINTGGKEILFSNRITVRQ
jgi:nitrogen fixation protein FixH